MESSIPVKAAIYIRVSTEDQAREGYSLPAQEQVLRKYCAKKGYEVHDLYADRGISGKDVKHRPEMLRLLQDVEADRINAVCVFALSRFSRSVADLYNLCSMFKGHDVSLESCTEPFDTSTPIGMAVVGILGVVAQLEREQTAERVKIAMAERARQGKRTCSCVLGYELDGTDNLTVNPIEAEIIRYIFDAYLTCGNLSEVARQCREHGYMGKRGVALNAYKIYVILTRPLYAGYNLYCGMLYRGIHAPIIPVSDFNEVQRRLMDCQRGRKRERERTADGKIPRYCPVLISAK